MVKPNLAITVHKSSALTYNLCSALDTVRNETITRDEREITIGIRPEIVDIEFERSHVGGGIGVKDDYRDTRKKLVIDQFIGCKARNESVLFNETKCFEGNKKLLPIPTKWFRWDPLNKLFMDHFNEATESFSTEIESAMERDLDNKPVMVLRPSNLTHAIMAFKVHVPELMRFNLFGIIVTEVEKIHRYRADGKYVDGLKQHIKNNLDQCGLEAISENTFAPEGVYGDKYTEPFKWALTPFIKGIDVRVIKAGNRYWIHDGWHEVKARGGKMIVPTELTPEFNADLYSEVVKVMDSKITPVNGSLDLRYNQETDKYFFLETSSCYSSERYPESFNRTVIDASLDYLIAIYDEHIGEFNEGWYERYKNLETKPVVDEEGPLSENNKAELKESILDECVES